MKINDDVLDVLRRSRVTGDQLELPYALERALYVRVAKVLEAAGAKWNRKAGRHIFQEPAEDLVADMLTTRTVLDAKRELGYFPSPVLVVARLMELADVERGMLCLEPSAGNGAIALALVKAGAEVDCVEVDPKRGAFLFETGLSVTIADFLQVEPTTNDVHRPHYDRVVMNPPFMRGSDARHVTHALKFVKPGGLVVSVMSAGFEYRQDRVTAALRERAAHWEPLPDDSFIGYGTSVRTVVVQFKG